MTDYAIEERLQRWDRQRSLFAARLSGWSAERLSFRPTAGVWSALEILDHLVKVDSSAVAAIRDSLPKRVTVTMKDRIGAFMVNGVMLSPIRVKVPASATAVLPQPTEDLSHLLERWNETHRAYTDLASKLTPEQRSAGVFHHPVAGWMSFAGALRFLSAHLRHHGYQLGRLEKTTR